MKNIIFLGWIAVWILALSQASAGELPRSCEAWLEHSQMRLMKYGILPDWEETPARAFATQLKVQAEAELPGTQWSIDDLKDFHAIARVFSRNELPAGFFEKYFEIRRAIKTEGARFGRELPDVRFLVRLTFVAEQLNVAPNDFAKRWIELEQLSRRIFPCSRLFDAELVAATYLSFRYQVAPLDLMKEFKAVRLATVDSSIGTYGMPALNDLGTLLLLGENHIEAQPLAATVSRYKAFYENALSTGKLQGLVSAQWDRTEFVYEWIRSSEENPGRKTLAHELLALGL